MVDPDGPEVIEYLLDPDTGAYGETARHVGDGEVSIDIGMTEVTFIRRGWQTDRPFRRSLGRRSIEVIRIVDRMRTSEPWKEIIQIVTSSRQSCSRECKLQPQLSQLSNRRERWLI